jgi:hypothetical protein
MPLFHSLVLGKNIVQGDENGNEKKITGWHLNLKMPVVRI